MRRKKGAGSRMKHLEIKYFTAGGHTAALVETKNGAAGRAVSEALETAKAMAAKNMDARRLTIHFLRDTQDVVHGVAYFSEFNQERWDGLTREDLIMRCIALEHLVSKLMRRLQLWQEGESEHAADTEEAGIKAIR